MPSFKKPGGFMGCISVSGFCLTITMRPILRILPLIFLALPNKAQIPSVETIFPLPEKVSTTTATKSPPTQSALTQLLDNPELQKLQSILTSVMNGSALETNGPLPCKLLIGQRRMLRFYLLKSDCKTYTELHVGDSNATLITAGFDPTKPLLLLTHGYLNSHDFPTILFPHSTARKYCKLGYNYNIVSLDYTMAFGFLRYGPYVCCGLKKVGTEGAEFISWLEKIGMADPAKTQAIGLSLGAPTVAEIANQVYEKLGKKFARLTGLDPTGVCFDLENPLTPTCPCTAVGTFNNGSAQYVQAIHTGGILLGRFSKCALADFWINGGYIQRAPLSDPVLSHVASGYVWEFFLKLQSPMETVACNVSGGYKNPYKPCSGTTVTFGERNYKETGDFGVPFSSGDVGEAFLETLIP